MEGDWTFEADVRVTGDGRLKDEGGPSTVAAGTVISDASDSY